MHIEIDGITIEIIKKAIKNINLRIYPPQGLVKVSAPTHMSERIIRQFLQEKSVWIRTQQERIQQRAPQKEELIGHGGALPFKGKNYLLIMETHEGPFQIQIKDELMYCFIPANTSALQQQALIERWYRQEMTALLPDLIKHWELIVGVTVKEWGIKKMKTRWGSCNTRARRIWLNLNLIKKPLLCLEYVLVHELTHLLEASHNQRFYKLLSQFMPQWRDYQYMLEGKVLI